jgi:hypothetical protein
MRVNIYKEEITGIVEVVPNKLKLTGLKFHLHMPVTMPDGTQKRGPFMHRPDDDDSSAVIFWQSSPAKLRELLNAAVEALNKYEKSVNSN